MKSTADANIPSKCFSPHQTPEWDDELKRAQKAANNAHKAWRNAGKPRNPDHPLRITYKDSKREFRAKLRNHRKNLRELFFSKLDLANTDSRKLFREIRNIMATLLNPPRSFQLMAPHFKEIPSSRAGPPTLNNLVSLPPIAHMTLISSNPSTKSTWPF